MGTLLYAPGVRIVIKTRKAGEIDISDDLTSGNVTLRQDGEGHSFSLSLANHKRKYDRVFTPNDRISIKMKRIRWVQVMSGYLDVVPYFSIYPRDISISGQCTLKVIKNFLWDPESQPAIDLLAWDWDLMSKPGVIDGGLAEKATKVLTEVVKWKKNRIHIASLPHDWLEKIESLQKKVSRQIQPDMSFLGGAGVYEGGSPLSGGGTTTTGNGPGTGTLPDIHGRISWFGGPNGGAYGSMALTGESGSNPGVPGIDPNGLWYVAMRFPYTNLSGSQLARAKAWWRNRKLLIYCPKTNKAAVGRAADWGPHESTGRVIDVAPHLLSVLGAVTDSVVDIRFADANAPLGKADQKDVAVPNAGHGWEGAGTGGGGSNTGTANGNGQGKGKRAFSVDGGEAFFEDDLVAETLARRSGATEDVRHGQGHPVRDKDNRPSSRGGGKLTVGAGVEHGDINIFNAVAKAIYYNLSDDYEVISWARRNSLVAGTGTVSYHDVTRGAVALDIRPKGYRIEGTSPCGAPGRMMDAESMAKNEALAAVLRKAGFATVLWKTCTGGNHYEHVHVDNRGEYINVSKDYYGVSTTSDKYGNYGNDSLIREWLGALDPQASDEGTLLSGYRGLMNDVPVGGSIGTIMTSSMRTHCSAPNGDFIGWFPDYFGQYGSAGKMKIQDIELAGDGFSISWSDRGLITHQFTMGAITPTVMTIGGSEGVDLFRKYMTMGIASVEFPEIMEALFNIDITPDSKDKKKGQKRSKAHDAKQKELYELFRAEEVLNRFGARKDFKILEMIMGDAAEFWSAVWWFQRSWATQFTARVQLTFMPELFPGMLIVLPSFKFQAYVLSVTHNFSFQDGGEGFTTEATIIAPSTTEKGGSLWGLPVVAN